MVATESCSCCDNFLKQDNEVCHIDCLFLSHYFSVEYDLWLSKTFTIVSSKTTNNRDKYNYDEKFRDTERFTKMWHRDTKWTNVVGKMLPIDLYDEGLPQPSICKQCSICKAQLSEAQSNDICLYDVLVFLHPLHWIVTYGLLLKFLLVAVGEVSRKSKIWSWSQETVSQLGLLWNITIDWKASTINTYYSGLGTKENNIKLSADLVLVRTRFLDSRWLSCCVLTWLRTERNWKYPFF